MDSEQVFTGYSRLILPNLSTARTSPRCASRVHASTPWRGDHLQPHLLVAVARCLGAYVQTRDVVLGWLEGDQRQAVRIHWRGLQSWKDVMQTIVQTDDVNAENNAKHIHHCAVISDVPIESYPLELVPSPGILRLSASTEFFHESTASVFLEQVKALAEHIESHPNSPIDDLLFLPLGLQSSYNHREEVNAYAHIELADFVTDYIARAAHSAPEKIAIQFFPDLLSSTIENPQLLPHSLPYAELHRRSNQFARYLLAEGLQREDRVGLCLQRDLDFHICMLGILKAGGCYVPIEPELPVERQGFIRQDSNARMVIDAASIEQRMQGAALHSEDDINEASLDGLAYLLYTSGTTGDPKGCLCTHRGLSEAILALSWFASEVGVENARYLAVASVAFDVHLAETFVPLALGITLVCAPRTQLLEDLPKWIRTLSITHVGIVPSLIEATMCAVEQSVDEEGEFKLKYIASGGEKMSDSILERWADHPQVKLANFYGPSEVTIGCTARFMSTQTRKENIGHPFLNCSAYVVDKNLNVVMRGAAGELLVAGPLVGRGYHGKPELTRRVFIAWDGQVAYRTGDLVRMMPDSTLEIIGRIDTQIKLRGVRIEAEGISNILRAAASTSEGLHLNIDAITVLAQHPAIHTDQIVSFVAWDQSTTISRRRTQQPRVLSTTPAALLRILKNASTTKLASYMRPAHIIPVEFLPLNPNGKTDSKALVALFQAMSLDTLGKISTAGELNYPEVMRTSEQWSQAETKLIDIISGETTISAGALTPRSNLFELGFDSIKFIGLASRIRSAFSLVSPLQMGEVMAAASIEALAILVEERGRTVPSFLHTSKFSLQEFTSKWKEEAQIAVEPDNVECILPTFPIQNGMLYRSTASPTLYVQHVLLNLHEEISVEALKMAWQTIIDQHQILRTIFLFSEAIVQIVLHSKACQLPWKQHPIYLRADENFLDWYLTHEAPAVSMEINREISIVPPLRLNLYRTNCSENSVLSISIHHALFDANSLNNLLKDVENEYLKEPTSRPVLLSRVLEEIYSVNLDKAQSYFLRAFEGFDWSRSSGGPASTDNIKQMSIPFKTTKLPDVQALASEAQVTPQVLLSSAYAACLCRYYYNIDDVILGVIRSGRISLSAEFNSAQCPLLSVLPLRVNFRARAFSLSKLQRNVAESIEFEHVPLGKIQQWIRPGKSLFDTLFSVSESEQVPSRIWDLLESTQPGADYFLAVEIVLDQTTQEVVVHAAFREDVISAEDVSLILGNLERVTLSIANINNDISVSLGAVENINQPCRPYHSHMAQPRDTYVVKTSSSEQEKRVQDLLVQFLNLDPDKISPQDTLIFLGLDSVKSIGLSRKLRNEGIDINAVEIMNCSTIRNLAARSQIVTHSAMKAEVGKGDILLAERRRTISASLDINSLKLSVSDVLELFPATVLQAGMLSQTVASRGHLYVHVFPFELSKSINLIRLKEAWKRAVGCFQILRTSFHFLGDAGCWVQAVHSELDFKWSEIPPSGVIEMHNQGAEFVNSIDLSKEETFVHPPVYFQLLPSISPSSASSRLVIVLHHALYDAISLSKVLRAVRAFYHGAEEVTEAPHFSDMMGYFEYQEEHGTEFWVRYLEDCHPARIPRAVSSSRARSHVITLDISMHSERFFNACKQSNVTPQCFGQVTWAISLAEIVHERDVVFGLVVSGRNAPQAEDVIGPMLNTIPCRVRIAEGTKYIDLLQSIYHNNLTALQWQHASLRAVQQSLGNTTLFDSIFLFQPIEELEDTDDLWTFDVSENEEPKVQYALNIELHQSLEHLRVIGACREDVMTADTLREVLQRFRDIFLHVVENPATKILCSGFNVAVETASGFQDSLDECNDSPVTISKRTWSAETEVIRHFLASATKVPIESIEPDIPLVSLGIDSISAIQIASRFRFAGIPLAAVDILGCEVVADLWPLLHRQHHDSVPKDSNVLKVTDKKILELLGRLQIYNPDDVQSILPVSPGMKWLIGVWQRSKRSRCQHAFAFHLPLEGFDAEKLKNAWKSLVQRHTILRTTFASLDNIHELCLITFQKLSDNDGWLEDDLRRDQTHEDALSKYMRDLVSNPLTTSRPPTRAILLRDFERKYLILQLHHFQYDAWSLPLLINDLTSLYNNCQASSGSGLVEFLDHLKPAESKPQQMVFWQDYFPPMFKRALFPSLVSKELASSRRLIFTNSCLVQGLSGLRQRALSQFVSLSAILLACWTRTQAKYTHSSSATFGLWHLGRSGSFKDIENLAVPCVNILPLYVDCLNTCTSVDVAIRIQADLRKRTAIIEQSDWENVNEWVSDSAHPLCNVFVNIFEVPHEEGELNASFCPVKMPYHIPKVSQPDEQTSVGDLKIANLIQDDLMVDIIISEREQSIAMSVECNEDILDFQEAQKLMLGWATDVQAFLHN